MPENEIFDIGISNSWWNEFNSWSHSSVKDISALHLPSLVDMSSRVSQADLFESRAFKQKTRADVGNQLQQSTGSNQSAVILRLNIKQPTKLNTENVNMLSKPSTANQLIIVDRQ